MHRTPSRAAISGLVVSHQVGFRNRTPSGVRGPCMHWSLTASCTRGSATSYMMARCRRAADCKGILGERVVTGLHLHSEDVVYQLQ